MILISCITEDYLPIALPFLCSLSEIDSVKKKIITVDFAVSEKYKEIFKYISFCEMKMPDTNSFKMIQHGAFLDSIPDILDDEILIVSDADIFVQRDFYESELRQINSLGDNEIFIGVNDGYYDSLEKEANRIQLYPHEVFFNNLNKNLPLRNCGLMIARVSVLKRIRKEYEKNCLDFYNLTSHRSRCQYLINWCIHKLGIEMVLMSEKIHTNGHFPLSDNCKIINGKLYYNNHIVMFKHKV